MPGTAETETAAIPSTKKSDSFIALRALARLTDENEQRCEPLNEIQIQTCLTTGPSELHFI